MWRCLKVFIEPPDILKLQPLCKCWHGCSWLINNYQMLCQMVQDKDCCACMPGHSPPAQFRKCLKAFFRQWQHWPESGAPVTLSGIISVLDYNCNYTGMVHQLRLGIVWFHLHTLALFYWPRASERWGNGDETRGFGNSDTTDTVANCFRSAERVVLIKQCIERQETENGPMAHLATLVKACASCTFESRYQLAFIPIAASEIFEYQATPVHLEH